MEQIWPASPHTLSHTPPARMHSSAPHFPGDPEAQGSCAAVRDILRKYLFFFLSQELQREKSADAKMHKPISHNVKTTEKII